MAALLVRSNGFVYSADADAHADAYMDADFCVFGGLCVDM